MEELSATNLLSLFETTKEQRRTFVADVVTRMMMGEVNPLNIHVQVKCMEELIKKLLEDKEYKKMVTEEASKYGNNPFEYHNAEISVRETGIKYDYSDCGDYLHDELNSIHALSTENLKQREKFLRNVPPEGMDIIVEDGVVFKIFPPTKSSTTTTVVTLK